MYTDAIKLFEWKKYSTKTNTPYSSYNKKLKKNYKHKSQVDFMTSHNDPYTI